MHELGITRNIVAIVGEQAGDSKVKRISLDIGKLSGIMPDAVRFCFDVCAKDTALEGAQLEINEIPGLGRCNECGNEIQLEHVYGQCVCGCRHIQCIAGEELMIKEMEVY